MSKEKSLDQKAMDLFAEGKISQEGVKALLMQNPETNSNQGVQPQNHPISQTENKKGFKVWPWIFVGLCVLGYFTYKNNPNLINQIKNFGIYQNQGQQTQAQNQIQNYSPQPVQHVEQEPIQEEITQEEIIQETIVGLNRWVSSPKLNYEFAVKGVGEKRINNYEYAQYCGTAKNIPSDQVAGWKSYFWDLIIIDVVAKGKTDSDLSINPQSFYLGGCSPTLIKDKTLVEMVSGTTEQIRVTRLTPAEMRLVYCEGSNMTGNGIPEILPRSGIMRLSTDEDGFKSLVEIGRMENQELQY